MTRTFHVLLFLSLSACGAKTGLYTTDGGVPPDLAIDVGIDAMDAGPDAPEPFIPCVEVPRSAGPIDVPFALPVRLTVVDVFFLVDATASMLDELDEIRMRLRSQVVPGVRAIIPDAAFGLGLTGEFPVAPHGPPGISPYELRAPLTLDVLRVEAALQSLPSWGNRDEPESQIEGLYQAVTGDGLLPWIAPSAGCPRGGSGGACFRRETLPVVLLITDAPMNNGPPGIEPVGRYRFEGPHTYAQTVAAVRDAGVFVIGLGARDRFTLSPMPHLRALARDTGTLTGGVPVAFDIGNGAGVGPGIVDAIARLAGDVPLDVDAVVEDVPGDAFDAREILRAMRPLSATPPSGVARITDDAFEGVVPGTEVTFRGELDVSSVPVRPGPTIIPARVLFRAFGRTRLERRRIDIWVPGTDGLGCPDR